MADPDDHGLALKLPWDRIDEQPRTPPSINGRSAPLPEAEDVVRSNADLVARMEAADRLPDRTVVSD